MTALLSIGSASRNPISRVDLTAGLMGSPTSAYAAGPGPEDWITLYHHTSPEAALSIMRERRMISSSPVDMPYAFFSTRPDGNASGVFHYGAAAVQVRVPVGITQVDESFHSGERYVKIRLEDLEPSHFIRVHRPQDSPSDDLSQADIAARLSADNANLGPTLPGYHWHSVVRARGWEQPRLDGGNGGQPAGFGPPLSNQGETRSVGATRERMDPPPTSRIVGFGRER
ncbi:hypothetical protein [Leekyejoonella antrihumi]|uniref:Enterotoxin n=1 Tax=Leekyejoonella antrihumi TaxID=1660198 RepID=A0A563DW90_9MICO|nr:hypothetical protein [Leekyejoonella antrihumi]TWP34476.1 hypothetical protein FGL98_17330 [Leekyejoonella antrihumi]